MAWLDRTGGEEDTVLLVDDQVSVREMVALVVGQEVGFAAIGAASGMEGLRLFARHRPAVVIAALALPELNGPGLIGAMREEKADVRLLVYSGSRNRELLLAGLDERPHGFVHKTESLETLRQAFRAVVQGSSFYGPFATRLADEARREERRGGGLTPKERRVLQLVAEGMSTKGVAGRLSISPKTVEHHRGQLMQKLGLRDVASLTRYAVRCGLVE